MRICHRTNGLLSDSVYVVAFFTDQIPINSGPESFNGLPGMILGVSLPQEHISWFASKVESQVAPIEKWDTPKDKNSIKGLEFKEKVIAYLKEAGSSSGGAWYKQFLLY